MGKTAAAPEPLPLTVSKVSEQPIYAQIREQLRGLILSGRLAPGTPLPSLRELTAQLACSLITVRRVYVDLEREGLLTVRPGIGTFVCDLQEAKAREWASEQVRRAFREAIREGLRYQLTIEEMSGMLRELLASECGA
ncbi:GntR family transcriptional regulator [Paenibacillus xanthanilyticus]|uniref:GntR family transcriptional regulator n=1 Tax=Paenibacillus xanthanilyticus TaxID=1783531 RepID=A0ABV8JVM7_9BACL